MACGLFRIFLFELVATFLYVLFGCGGVVGIDSKADSTYFGLYLGMVGVILVHIFGSRSGTLLNPCVAVAGFVSGIIPWDHAATYMVAQFAGAFGGYQLLNFVVGSGKVADASLCWAPSSTLDDNQVIGMEAVISLVLIFGLFSMMQGRNKDIMPFRFGALLAVCVIVGVLTSGIGLNSAVMVAVGASTNNFEKFEFYIGGQMLGAVAAALLWKYVINRCR